MGCSESDALLMQMPQGVVMWTVSVLLASGTKFFPYRLFRVAIGISISLTGSCMLSFADSYKMQYACI